MGLGIQTQPDFTVVKDELGYVSADGTRPANLVDRLVGGGVADTPAVAKGVCAAVLGSAITLVQ
jgi:capsule polysaccharide export protein KpsC/LpsZ